MIALKYLLNIQISISRNKIDEGRWYCLYETWNIDLIKHIYRNKRKVDVINFCMREGGCAFFWMLEKACKIQGFLIFKILPMLLDYRILFVRNTVEMAGGCHIRPSLLFYCKIILVKTIPLCRGLAWLPSQKLTI